MKTKTKIVIIVALLVVVVVILMVKILKLGTQAQAQVQTQDEDEDEDEASYCMIVVAKDKSGNFTTISEAINFIQPTNAAAGPAGCVIRVKEGLYEEIVTIPYNKTYIQLLGDGINKTIVSANRSSRAGYGTDITGILEVYGNGFTAIDMTFQNVAGPRMDQACALVSEADHLTFHRCQFLGYQDTIYTKSGTHFFRDCEIKGTIDVICGDGAVVFQNCRISVRKPMPAHFNTITAQQRVASTSNTGTVFHMCTIVPDMDFNPPNTTQTYLGRPWGEFSRTVVMKSFLYSFIDPQGWIGWTASPLPTTVYYAEFDNTGPGADTSKRLLWSKVIPASEAEYFTVKNFLQGDTWIPKNVPYTLGL